MMEQKRLYWASEREKSGTLQDEQRVQCISHKPSGVDLGEQGGKCAPSYKAEEETSF